MDEKKAGEILLVVLQTGHQDLAAILFCRLKAGDGSGIGKAFRQNVLHAPCSVIERHGRDSTMAAKKVTALIQRDRMREHPANFFQPGARSDNQIVLNTQPHLSVNKNIALKEQIKVL